MKINLFKFSEWYEQKQKFNKQLKKKKSLNFCAKIIKTNSLIKQKIKNFSEIFLVSECVFNVVCPKNYNINIACNSRSYVDATHSIKSAITQNNIIRNVLKTNTQTHKQQL